MRFKYTPNTQNLLHQKFGQLTAIGNAGRKKRPTQRGYDHYWLCRCTCGGLKIIESRHFKDSHSSSCGCQASRNTMGARSATHGMSNSAEYGIWCKIKERCYNPEIKSFKNYGGRGIQMSDEWRDSFPAFYADMGARPGPEYSVERLNNDGHYEKDNTTWATDMEQGANKRNNVLLTFQGETLHLSAWARRTGLKRLTLAMRIRKGWSVEKALTTPLMKNQFG